jgi:peptidoglycan/LPS O-acetylase OafA/YrhL
MTPGALFITTLAAVFFLPVPPVLGVTDAFPLNVPRWSLFLEITINLLWAAMWRRLSTPVLIAICIGGALALAVGARAFGSLDFGWYWGTIAPSFARVFWCFPAGLLTYRLVGNQARTLPAWTSYGMLLALAAVLWLPISDSWRWLYDLTASIVVFPLLVAIGARAKPPIYAAPALSFLGITSYAVYILHVPLIRPFLWAAGKVFPGHLFQHMWIVVIIFIATVVVSAWLADAIFDRPARRWFNANLVRLSLRWQNSPG